MIPSALGGMRPIAHYPVIRLIYRRVARNVARVSTKAPRVMRTQLQCEDNSSISESHTMCRFPRAFDKMLICHSKTRSALCKSGHHPGTNARENPAQKGTNSDSILIRGTELPISHTPSSSLSYKSSSLRTSDTVDRELQPRYVHPSEIRRVRPPQVKCSSATIRSPGRLTLPPAPTDRRYRSACHVSLPHVHEHRPNLGSET